MECIVPGVNMKVLGKSLQALSKIGDELFVEAKKGALSFIALNASKTVCAQFHYYESFFSSYEIQSAVADDSDSLTCKVQMKILLPLFKGNIEKKLDYLRLEYSTDSDFIILKMKYKCDDILMVHKLRLMDNEKLSIGVNTDATVNNVGASSSFYNQMLTMFSITDDEITFEISPTKVIARNYCMGTPCRPKMMRTQINLNSSEFLSYRITQETTINFSLKPFRTVINFAETFNLNIEFAFDTGGKPLAIVVKNPTFEANFIVATLNPYADANSSAATSNSLGTRIQVNAIPGEVAKEDLNAMRAETWDEVPSKESGFTELLDCVQKNVKDNFENDVIPASPESPRSKKAKFVFGRCYDETFHQTILGDVLVPESDSE